jgi:hypothetical protein
MMFAGLDVEVGDVVVIESVDSRSLMQYTVIGEIHSIGCAGDVRHLAIETKTRRVLMAEKWVRRIAFLYDEEDITTLLINI